MCSNFEAIKRDRAFLLNLPEPTQLEFPDEIFPTYNSPLIFSNKGNIEWRAAKFGMIPKWAKELKYGRHTYNARTETVAEKPSFKNAWHKNQFALIPVETIYEPKYINGKPHWYGIAREDGMPFTVAAIYESAMINEEQIRSMSMLTINADKHPFMKQFHAPQDEKRSIIVIPEEYREDWLNTNFEEAHEFFFEMPDEFVTFPKNRLSETKPQRDLF
ncbi:MAG: SOS response-associated peptidase family protein [Acinetobacter gandensis]|uniref:SOS response-associated peptidase family protein n=1 Tax=Acinetobacter gandensis TaxID=1443941 RepID=UPI003D03217B